MYGTPGPVYIDLTSDVLYGKVKESEITFLEDIEPIPKLILSDDSVTKTLALLK